MMALQFELILSVILNIQSKVPGFFELLDWIGLDFYLGLLHINIYQNTFLHSSPQKPEPANWRGRCPGSVFGHSIRLFRIDRIKKDFSMVYRVGNIIVRKICTIKSCRSQLRFLKTFVPFS